MKRSYMAAIVVAVLAAGCGSSASVSPTGPSATGVGTGTSIIGSVNGTTPVTPAGVAGAMKLGSTLTVSVAGTSVTAPVDANGQFVLNNVPSGDLVLQFSGPGVDARVTLSGITTGDQIHIDVLVGGNNAVVTNDARVHSGNGNSGNKNEIEGLITAINMSTHTLTVNGKTVSVPVSATIRHGNTTVAFTDLKVGQRVHVKANSDASNNLIATEVMLQDDGTGGIDDNEQTLKGTVSALSGTCPTISFTVASTSVSANAATDYKGIVCADVKNGTSVEVEAMKPASGPSVAMRIAIQN